MSILLIADLVVSVLVFICVALTLLEIVGGAYFLGLTIEIVTSIVLILSVKFDPNTAQYRKSYQFV